MVKKVGVCIVGAAFFAFLIQWLFQLHIGGTLVIWFAGIFVCPFVIQGILRDRKRKAEYYEVITYMEQLLCSYKRIGNIGQSLEDCIMLFPCENHMGKILRHALHILRTGEGVEGNKILSRAFGFIHEKYPGRRLLLIHDFLCKVEKMGGDTAEALDIMLNELQLWKERNSLFQKKKEHVRMECVVSSILAVMLCCVTRFLIPATIQFQVVNTTVFQISTIVVICVFLFILAFVFSKMTGRWLDTDEPQTKREKKRIQMKYKRLIQDDRKGRGKWLAKKICREEIERQFPYWLLAVTLYLQQESVYQAIQSSVEHSQGIFLEELQRLLRQLYEEPGKLEPFVNFFAPLELTEIQTGMKILYSVNNNGYQDTYRQVRALVEENNLIMDKCERRRFDNQMAGVGLIRQIPMIFACVKLILDVAAVLIVSVPNLFL